MPQPIREVLPGVVHWTAKHPNIGMDVSSYYLVDERIALDPLEPPDGLDWFEGREPREIVLSTRHHLRDAVQFADRFGATVRAPRAGMHELPEDRVEPYEWGSEVVGGIRARHVLDEWPDETTLELPSHSTVAIADCVINYGDQLNFVPDEYFGENADDEKAKIRAAMARVAEEVEFDNLLFGHGDPVIGGARDKLRSFAAGQ
jgi:hypothetical protein